MSQRVKAWIVFCFAMLIRAWALPLVAVGWVFGVIAQALALGWGLVFDDPMIKWAVKATTPPRATPHPYAFDDDVVVCDDDDEDDDEDY